MTTALQVTAALWDRHATPWEGVEVEANPVNWGAGTKAAIKAKK